MLESFLTSVPSRSAAREFVAAIRRAYAGLPVLDRLGSRSVMELIMDSFTAPEVRTFLLMLAHELGGDVTAPGGDVGFLGVVCRVIGDRAVPVGGMGSVVAAYQRLAHGADVEITCDTQVERILVTDSTAVGVVSTAGHTVRARRLVVSTLPRERTRALLGDEPCGRVGSVVSGATDVIKLHLLLREPPVFDSAREQPDVAESVQTFFGWDDPSCVLRRLDDLRRGSFPTPGGALLRPALADPSQASTPERLLAIDSTFPTFTSLTDMERDAVATRFPPAAARRLRRYASNLADDAVAESFIAPLWSVPREIDLSRTGSSHYRMPGIGRLYLAGADRHPGSGIHGACDWNAASVAIADHF